MTRSRRAFLLTAGTVLVADPFALLLAYHIGASWWTLLMVAIFNLPALPTAVAFAILLQDPLPQWKIVAMYVSLVLISSLGWGVIAAIWFRRQSGQRNAANLF
jgi:hypothetical protein